MVSEYGKLLYVYVRSSYRDIPLAKALSAHKEIIEYIKREWVSFSLYEKAIAAVSLYRYGFTDEAKEILESLREYSTTLWECFGKIISRLMLIEIAQYRYILQ